MRVWREQVIGRSTVIFTDAEYQTRLPYLKRAFEVGDNVLRWQSTALEGFGY